MQEDSDPESNRHACEEPRRHHGRKEEAHPGVKSSSKHRAAKRPDKPLYMPRAARQRLSLQQEPAEEAASAASSRSDSEDSSSLTVAGHEHLAAVAPPSSRDHATEQPPLPDECLPPLADLTLQEEEEEQQESLPGTLDEDLLNKVEINHP